MSMINTNPSYVQFLADTNKIMRDQLKEVMAKNRSLMDNNIIMADELRAWEHTAKLNGWDVRLVYPQYTPQDQRDFDDIPF